MKAGIQAKRFPIKEQFSFLITDPAFNDPMRTGTTRTSRRTTEREAASPFHFSGSNTGTYLAGFVQDNIRWNDFTMNVGVRFDHNKLFESESQLLEPRIGLAYFLQGDKHRFPRVL